MPPHPAPHPRKWPRAHSRDFSLEKSWKSQGILSLLESGNSVRFLACQYFSNAKTFGGNSEFRTGDAIMSKQSK